MKYLFSLTGILCALITSAQYFGLPYYYIHSDEVHIEGHPILIGSDTVLNSDCSIYRDSVLHDCVFDVDVIFHYDDSSVAYYYYTEKGKTINQKRYGIWQAENGYYRDSMRIKSNCWIEHYVNGYKIPFAEHVSDTVYYNVESTSAICIMTHFGSGKFPETKIKLEYYPVKNPDVTYVRCSTMDNREVFLTTTIHVKEEIKMVIDGLYNRKIYMD